MKIKLSGWVYTQAMYKKTVDLTDPCKKYRSHDLWDDKKGWIPQYEKHLPQDGDLRLVQLKGCCETKGPFEVSTCAKLGHWGAMVFWSGRFRKVKDFEYTSVIKAVADSAHYQRNDPCPERFVEFVHLTHKYHDQKKLQTFLRKSVAKGEEYYVEF